MKNKKRCECAARSLPFIMCQVRVSSHAAPVVIGYSVNFVFVVFLLILFLWHKKNFKR